MPSPLVVLAGPTGTGKTALSLDLAELLTRGGQPAEIINADSLQLYRGMDIGTAKLPATERRGIPHHLFDVLDVSETATVASYQHHARAVIAELRGAGVVPILVGGSGLYISAVLGSLSFPGSSPEIRSALERRLEDEGIERLWQQLHQRDPDAAARIGPYNARRIVRALEVIELTGSRYSASLPDEAQTWVPTVQVFLDGGSDGDREELKRRLAERSRAMWKSGLLEEVRTLIGQGLREGQTARQAIGYAQALAVLDGVLSEQEAVSETTRLTWRYARRQRSWFNRYRSMHRLDWQDDGLAATVRELLDHEKVASAK